MSVVGKPGGERWTRQKIGQTPGEARSQFPLRCSPTCPGAWRVVRLLEEIPTARFAACEGDHHSSPYQPSTRR